MAGWKNIFLYKATFREESQTIVEINEKLLIFAFWIIGAIQKISDKKLKISEIKICCW